MKSILAAIAIIAATSAAAQQKEYNNVAYYSGPGESLVLLKDECQIPGMPAFAKRATYIAYMTIVEGCYVVTSQNTVTVAMQNGVVRDMHRRQFKQWDIQ